MISGKSAIACRRSRPPHSHRFCHAKRGPAPAFVLEYRVGPKAACCDETPRPREEGTITTPFNTSNSVLLISLLAWTGCGTSPSTRALDPSSVSDCSARHAPVTDAALKPQQPANGQLSSSTQPAKAASERGRASEALDDTPPGRHLTDDTPINSGAGNAIPLSGER